MSGKKLSASDKRALAKQRKEAAKQARDYHREQEKQAKQSSAKAEKSAKPAKPEREPKPEKRAERIKRTPKAKKPEKEPKQPRSQSKIEEAVNSGKTAKFQKISREEKFMRESDEKIRNLKPQDFEDGYYIDEYSEKQRRDRRAKVIRKQENEVIRRNKKPLTQRQIRLRRIIITASIFAVVLIVGVILSLTVLFKTEKIEVEGDTYYYPEQIIAFSNVEKQQNIFLAKLGATPEEIVRNLPYVEDASVEFSVPDTITIKITDAVPSYVIKEGSSFIVISSKGRILDKTEENALELTELKCGEFKSREIGDYVEFSDSAIPDILESVAKSLRSNGVENVVGFDVTDTSAITLNYDGRILINIGVAEDIEYKIKTAVAIITQKLDPNNTGQVYGTLDVSTCSKNKMSHYKPAETMPAATEPATTQPATDAADYGSYDAGGYSGYDNSYDNGGYDNSYDSGYDNGGYDNSYDNGYDYGGYDTGYGTGYDTGYDTGYGTGYDTGYDPYAYGGGAGW